MNFISEHKADFFETIDVYRDSQIMITFIVK